MELLTSGPAAGPAAEAAGLSGATPSEVTDTSGQQHLPLAYFPLQGAFNHSLLS